MCICMCVCGCMCVRACLRACVFVHALPVGSVDNMYSSSAINTQRIWHTQIGHLLLIARFNKYIWKNTTKIQWVPSQFCQNDSHNEPFNGARLIWPNDQGVNVKFFEQASNLKRSYNFSALSVCDC